VPLPLTQLPTDPFVSFLSAPTVTELSTLDAHVAVLGMPFGVPYGMHGVASDASNAPAAIRAQSARFGHGRFLQHFDFDVDGALFDGRDIRVVDCGDVAADPLDIPGNAARATAAVRAVLERGAVPIVLGGDDSIPIPFLRAYEGFGPLAVVQIDAHLDFRDELDGVREGFSSPMRRASEMPWVTSITQIGLRGVGSGRPSDVADARSAGNTLIPARELHARGVNWALEQIPAGAHYLVTIDLDGLDPSVAPGVGAPSPGGLSWDEARELVQGLAARGRIAGLDVVEIMPSLDVNQITSIVATRLILNAIGGMVRSGQLDPT
jgi:agmatinase